MNTRILVAYATKHGATAEIAEEIGRVLRQAGMSTDVLPVGSISDLTPYEAIVVGSAVYIGQWRKEAVKFLQAHENLLTERQVWLFSSGPTGVGDPVELTKGWRFPDSLQSLVERVQPRDIAIFHGNVQVEKLNFVEKQMVKMVQAPIGDFRNWEAIASWAEAIADVLEENTLAIGALSAQ